MITLVIFSKDRAMQLDSLLRSIADHCTGVDWIAAIVDASSDLHERAYDVVASEYEPRGGFRMLRQRAVGGLGVALGATLKHGDHIALAVDDMLFYRPSNFAEAVEALEDHGGFVWSWRLGYDVNFTESCTAVDANRVSPRAPTQHWLTTSLVQSPDYSYLFHSDGALYKTSTYVNKLDTYLPPWRTCNYIPNDLEAAVAARRSQWALSAGPHVGPMKPTCITWQLNRVQSKYGSPAAEIKDETDVDTLARAYLHGGRRVDNEKLYKMLQEDALRFNPPGARPTHVYASEEASKFWASAIR